MEAFFCTRISGDVSNEVSPTEVATENVEREDTYCTMTNDENQIDTTITDLFVCPINVPEQTSYIPMQVSNAAAVADHDEKCFAWFPAWKMK